jgi:ATP-dependent Clp protease protease subunit
VIGARTGMRTDIAGSIINRWNSDIQAATDKEAENTISILEPIGADWWGEGVTSKRILAALRAIGDKDVVVSINSPGGDYFEGLSIYNALRDHKGKVTVKILGLAASAASVIAMAGDDVLIARAGFLMIHNTWVVAGGDRHALREVADWLEPFDAAAVNIYAARTSIDEKKLGSMLDRETWIGGTSAVDQGFADGLLPSDEVASGTKQSAARDVRAEKKFDLLAAKAGLSRSEARELLASLKGSTPGAASSGMQDAAVVAEVRDLLNRMNAI